MQSKFASACESVANTASGFIISLLVWSWVVVPLFDFQSSHSENFYITCIFTITSLIRSYVFRRIFNKFS